MGISEYDIAQRRLERRRSSRFAAFVGVAIFAAFLLLAMSNSYTAGCTIPFMVISGIASLSSVINYYLYSPHYHQNEVVIEQEMSWLFGENWELTAGNSEYALAQDRLRNRRKTQIWFSGHLTLFLVMLLLVVPRLGVSYLEYAKPGLLIFGGIWVALIAVHAFRAFPPPSVLAEREQNAGEALQKEITLLQKEKAKNEGKLKRDVLYTVGEDGELVELSAEEAAARRLGGA